MRGREDVAPPWPLHWLGVAALVFVAVATLNSAGYRYGTGDQAFYLPAIQRHLEPDSFPRDRILIDDQDRLNVFPRAAAGLILGTGASEPALFLGLYLASLLLLCAAARAFAASLGLSPWAQLAFLAALTLKHRVGLTGVNTLEGYAHPRMLAFAIGLTSLVFLLRGRPRSALVAVALAFVVHPTTALWFWIWVGVALIVSEPPARGWLSAGAGAAAVVLAWAIGRGPLSAQAVRMDEAWLGVLAGKDYLFATDWPASTWAIAVLCVVVVAAGFAMRRRSGVAHPREGALVAGLAALVGVFIATLPFIASRLAIAVQFQVSRILWMVDLTATLYVVWGLADCSRTGGGAVVRGRRAVALALSLVCVAAARGAWVMWVEHPGRPVVQTSLPHDEWQDAMAWIARQPAGIHVLADPAHAWRYPSSVRVAAGRDVYLEEVKDTAMAMYSRRVAMRVAERVDALGDFGALTPGSARALAGRFDLDVLVTERAIDLPLAYRNTRFSIYRLRP